MKCYKCGYIIPDDSEFCQFCGVKIENKPEILSSNESVEGVIHSTITPKQITESQRYFDSDYGYSSENPIVTSSVQVIGYYLYALRTEDGQNFTWKRQPSQLDSMIDEYHLFINDVFYKAIFFNPHGEDRDFVPKGLVKDTLAFTAAQRGVTLEEHIANLSTEELIKKRKKRKQKLWLLIPSVIILSLLLAFFVGIPGIKYIYANNLLQNGKYDEAYSAFLDLGSFGKSEEMLLETKYQQALDLRNKKDFDSANKIFGELGNYKDSQELIHNHEYDTIIEKDPTCTSEGLKRNTCSCGDTYTEDIKKISHEIEVISITPSTCTAPGRRLVRCLVCNEQFTETIYQQKHQYTAPTCTTSSKCKVCGKLDHYALGHTNTAVCTRCGKVLFENKISYGHGPNYISGITLPEGTYNISFFHNGSSNFAVKFNSGYYSYDHLLVNEIGYTSYVYQLKVTTNEPVKNGYFNVVLADGDWFINIEAIK